MIGKYLLPTPPRPHASSPNQKYSRRKPARSDCVPLGKPRL